MPAARQISPPAARFQRTKGAGAVGFHTAPPRYRNTTYVRKWRYRPEALVIRHRRPLRAKNALAATSFANVPIMSKRLPGARSGAQQSISGCRIRRCSDPGARYLSQREVAAEGSHAAILFSVILRLIQIKSGSSLPIPSAAACMTLLLRSRSPQIHSHEDGGLRCVVKYRRCNASA